MARYKHIDTSPPLSFRRAATAAIAQKKGADFSPRWVNRKINLSPFSLFNPKDLAIAISIEASELLEVYLWKEADKADVNKVKDELADIFAFAFQLAAHYDLDIGQIISEKMEKNRLKYPVEKAKGTAKKYTEL